MKIKNRLIYLTAIAVISFYLLWTGLHDIIKGEEDITLELTAVIISAAIIVYIAFRIKKIRTRI